MWREPPHHTTTVQQTCYEDDAANQKRKARRLMVWTSSGMFYGNALGVEYKRSIGGVNLLMCLHQPESKSASFSHIAQFLCLTSRRDVSQRHHDKKLSVRRRLGRPADSFDVFEPPSGSAVLVALVASPVFN